MAATVIPASNAIAYSSFGSDVDATTGDGFRARSVLFGERYAELDRRQSYYDCTQHDDKGFDFDGRVWSPRSAQPLLGAEKASWFVPLKARRPSSPYRLPRIITDSFTNLLFGENRFPQLRVEGDAKSEDFAQTLARVGRLGLRMIQARTMGGACGTVGLSWSFFRGRPRFECHNAKHLFVHSWDDRTAMIPRHVSEVYPFYKVQWNGKAFAKVWYWYRRDWTPEWDVAFEDVLWEPGKDPWWVVDARRSTRHDDGVCHLEWIQNLPGEGLDGLPDYDGLYESFDAMDTLMSVIIRGATLNLDPTVKLKVDPEILARVNTVKKGSDNVLTVGKDGDADYMELSGSSIEAGIKLLEMKRRTILETAQCIVPDPHEVAAQGVSSVAIKAMFAPMLGKGDVLREQYGAPIERMLGNMSRVAREKTRVSVQVLDIKTGREVEGAQVLELPPKVTAEPVVSADGKPTGEVTIKREPRAPGDSDDVTARWPPYFPPTPADQAQIATTLTTATGGKAFASQQTAVEVMAQAFGSDPAQEWQRVQSQGQQDHERELALQESAGAPGDDLPPGAKPRGLPPDGEGETDDEADEADEADEGEEA